MATEKKIPEEIWSARFGSPVYEQRLVSYDTTPGQVTITDFTGDRFSMSRRVALSLYRALGDWIMATEPTDGE